MHEDQPVPAIHEQFFNDIAQEHADREIEMHGQKMTLGHAIQFGQAMCGGKMISQEGVVMLYDAVEKTGVEFDSRITDYVKSIRPEVPESNSNSKDTKSPEKPAKPDKSEASTATKSNAKPEIATKASPKAEAVEAEPAKPVLALPLQKKCSMPCNRKRAPQR